MSEPILPPLKPLPIKDRISVVYVEKGNLDVLDGAFVVVDKTGVRTHLPIGGVACLMLEPGARVSHSAVVLAARVGCLLVWIGEAGVRLYAAGQPGGARSDRLLYQAKLALDDDLRLKVVRAMYRFRFQEELLGEAKAPGKIESGYEIPRAFRNNTPEWLEKTLGPARKDGSLPEYPFGTDLTAEEIALIPAMTVLKNAQSSVLDLARLAAQREHRGGPWGRAVLTGGPGVAAGGNVVAHGAGRQRFL